MVCKKRRFSGFIALAAFVLFAPLVAIAYELPSLEYDFSLDLSYAGRMAQDADGSIYIADLRQSRVYVFDKYGRSIDVVNSIAKPAAVAASSTGEIYVASPHGVYLLGDNGQASSIVGQDALDLPVDMAIDAAGQIYLLDAGSRSVKVFSASGVSLGEFAGGAAKYPVSIAIGKDSVTEEDLVYVGYSMELLDADNTEIIMVYDSNYNLVRSFGTAAGASRSDLGQPSGEVPRASGITVDGLGRIYVADTYGRRIDIYSELGDFLGEYVFNERLVYDGSGNLLGGYGTQVPYSLLFDMYGRLFVSLKSGKVDIFSIDGQNVANVIPTAPSLSSPLGGVRIGTATPDLVVGNSLDPNRDNLIYEFDVASSSSMSDVVWASGPVAEGADGYTAVALGISLDEDREYYWRARSFDGIEYSRYSYVTRFFVNTVNSVPSIDSYSPSTDSVAGVAVGEAVPFAVVASDSDRDRLSLSWFLNDLEVSSGVAYSYVAGISDVGENIIKMVASDGQLTVERQWSVTVMRPNTAPTAPALNAPNGSEDVATLRPELSVSNSFDAEGDGLLYTFEVSVKENFSEIVATIGDVAPGSGFTTSSVNVDLIENGLYYWRAKSCEVSVSGDFVAEYYCSNPSETGTFIINTVNDPVGVPAVGSPSNGTHVNTIDQSLLLSVDNASDLDRNDNILYDFELSADQAFSSVIALKEGVVEGASGSTSVEVAVGLELEENRTYYWRARAADAETVSAWVSASFFVDNYNDAPTTPLVDSPLGGSETVIATPVLSVINSEDFNGDTLYYIFEIDSNDNFSSSASQKSALLAEGDLTTSWTVINALLDNTRYYWRVKANDGVSESAWSAVNELFINVSNDAPTAPVVKAPSGGIKVNVDSPELTIYSASDVDGDMLTYSYQLSRTGDFASVETESSEEGLAWTVDIQLEENAIYYWRSKATDEHGLSGVWSASGAFMVNVVNENPRAPVAGSYTYSAGDEVLLHIGRAIDPDGDFLAYSVELYSDRGMTALAYTEEGINGDSEVVANAGALAPGVYYWRVKAFDGKLYGSWSDTRIVRVNASGTTVNDRVDKAQGHKRF